MLFFLVRRDRRFSNILVILFAAAAAAAAVALVAVWLAAIRLSKSHKSSLPRTAALPYPALQVRQVSMPL